MARGADSGHLRGVTPRRPLPHRRTGQAARFAFALVVAAAAVAGPPGTVAAQGTWAEATRAWGAVATPLPGPARVFGTTNSGCVAGAAALPPEGPGYQAVRLSRNRAWGHPSLVAWVEDIGRRARASGLPDLWIGDLAQPRGGPMAFGHASHQTGLDVDVWLDLRPKPPGSAATRGAREAIEVPSVVRADGEWVDAARWTAGHARLVRLAAEGAGVDRVLVNPAIKRALCAAHGGEAWLRRVRPWRGHDSHMHVRLRCPADSPDCRDIAPPPPGDGCDSTLEWWFTEEARRPPSRGGPANPPFAMPAACSAVLRGDLAGVPRG